MYRPSTLTYGNTELSREMQEKCREVASELRIIGDSLEIHHHKRIGLINDNKRIFIGATLLGIATNILIGYLSRVLSS